MTNTHDPYLNTVKRSLNEAKIKSRKTKVKRTDVVEKNFFSRSIILSDYIYLPESLEKFLLLNIFVFIPYIFGLLIMFIIMNEEKFQEFRIFNFDIYMLTWIIGYESIALILLILIIKSAFTFRRK